MQDVSKMLSVLTILGGVTVFGVETFQPSDPPDLVQPVALVELFKEENPLKPFNRGSGVFVAPTQILTAAHVVNEVKEKGIISKVRMNNGDTYNIIDVNPAENMDIGIITVDRPYKGYLPEISCDAQKIGDELITIGNPLMMEFLESKITVAGGRPSIPVPQDEGRAEAQPDKPVPLPEKKDTKAPDIKKRKFTRIPPEDVGPPKEGEKANLTGAKFFQGPALPGQSGSPVFNKDGKIVGIVAITIVDSDRTGSYTGIGMYIANSDSCKFLKDNIKK